MAACHSVNPGGWERVLAGVLASFAGRFGRVEPRRTAAAFVTGLLSDIEVKTCWQLAEQAGHARPDAMQRLLFRAVWDAEAVRDDLRQVIVGRFGAPEAVLVGYAGRDGHTLIDRRVYLPVSWTEDRGRCQAAGVPDEIGFATKSELAAEMITAAVDAGVPVAWAAADEAYGNSSVFRNRLRGQRLGYVLAVSRSHLVPLDGGKVKARADRIAAELPASAWQRRSAGAGSKGPRYYDWAWLDQVTTDADPDDGGRHSLLIRRNTSTGELAFYRCWTPQPATLAQLVRVAGIRWTVEEAFQAAKSQVGLDQHQVRRWDSWHRFTILALAALAVLAICAADTAGKADDDPGRTGLIKLTVNEVRRLINAFIIRPISDLAHRLRWSQFRRRHQARARRSHYTRRLNPGFQP
ncbi:SRSO17 transposase [Micromonospora pallida]|uniref:SRSO17 transposase n=1 Tax=Micromonospora pallida TaxID=145854 RepID=A0A1C6TC23_9ACTN|nr:SRSO17 transposase [Micromonospora pallida]